MSSLQILNKEIRIDGRLVRVAHFDGEKYNFPDDPEAFVSALRKCGMRVDLFTFLQRPSDPTPKYSYPMEWDNLAAIAVSSFDHWWKSQIRSAARNRARQAENKGVTFRVVSFGDELLKGICEIYNECPIRLGKPFPHYGMTIEEARVYAGTYLDRSTYIGAFLDGSMIGFIKLVTDDKRNQACLIHILSMVKHRDKAPTNALIAQAVRYCADNNIRHLIYEKFCYGSKPKDSLGRFKEVNGFQKLDLPRYYIPLTTLGRIAHRCGLHHRIGEILPESLVARLRSLRTAWYSRRFPTDVEA